MKKFLSGLLATMVILFAWTAVQADAAALVFDRDSLTLSVGRYSTVHATVTPKGALREGVIYSTSDESIATVEQDGKVRGVAAGSCEVTATSKYDATVTVTIPVTIIVPVREVEITSDQTSVQIGGTLQLTAAVKPENATMQGVVFSSSDESVFTVTEDGLVTGVSRGKATVTAASADGKATDKTRITVTQPPESVTVSPTKLTLAEGKTATLKAAVSPANTDDTTVLWASADESVATVSKRGVVTGVSLGDTVITATCRDNENASFLVPVSVLKLATGVLFGQDTYDVVLGGTVQLSQTVLPATTSNQAVTYKTSSKKIATVDANGLVTALKGGTATITVTTADGSRKNDTATVRVIVPVTGVSYPRSDVRVGQGYYGHVTVNLAPSDATNNNMTWVSEDPSIADVSGTTNTVKIEGKKYWGRTRITGTTEDGGYAITLNVNVGSLYRAVSARTLEIRSGEPYISLKNNSDMVITQVRFTLRGLDAALHPIQMSTTGDLYALYGTYDLAMYPDEYSQQDSFSFFAPSAYPNLTCLSLVITGWSTDTGYYDSNGTVQYEYTIGSGNQKQVVYPAGTDPTLFVSP